VFTKKYSEQKMEQFKATGLVESHLLYFTNKAPQMRLFRDRDLTDQYMDIRSFTIANLYRFVRIEDFKKTVNNLKDLQAIIDFTIYLTG
jgi:hypothetical protein